MGALVLVVAFLPIVGAFTVASFLSDLTFRRAAIIGAVVVSAVGWYLVRGSDWYRQETWQAAAGPMPPDEAAFTATPSPAARAFACGIQPSPVDWTGVIDSLYLSAAEDAAILNVRIGPTLVVRSPTDFSLNNKVLVPMADGPALTLTGLAVGDRVRFSADWLRDGKNCLRATGGTGERADPDLGFLAKFTRIGRLAAGD
jgi:hypothetical protein